MSVTFRAWGAFASGTTSASAAVCTGAAATDTHIGFVDAKPYNVASTASNFTGGSLGYSAGAIAAGTAVGSTRSEVFYKTGASATLNAANASGTPTMARQCSVYGSTGAPLNTPVRSGGFDDTLGAAVSISGTHGSGINNGDLILFVLSSGDDAHTVSSIALSIGGVAQTLTTEAKSSTTSGGDGLAYYGRATVSGITNGATSWSMTGTSSNTTTARFTASIVNVREATSTTKLYLRAAQTDVVRPPGSPVDSATTFTDGTSNPVARLLSTTAGSSVASETTASATGAITAPGLFTDGGALWTTPPIATQVTISGPVEFSIWANEANAAANAALTAVLWRISPDGTETVIANAPNTTEVGASDTEMVWWLTPTSTVLAPGDILALGLFWDDASAVTMATGYTLTIKYDAAAAATGDSFVGFAETFSFASTPAGTTLNFLDDASDLVDTGPVHDYAEAWSVAIENAFPDGWGGEVGAQWHLQELNGVFACGFEDDPNKPYIAYSADPDREAWTKWRINSADDNDTVRWIGYVNGYYMAALLNGGTQDYRSFHTATTLGGTWTRQYYELATVSALSVGDMCYGNGYYLAVGEMAVYGTGFFYSTDLTSWTRVTTYSALADWCGWDGTNFLMQNASTYTMIYATTPGGTWTAGHSAGAMSYGGTWFPSASVWIVTGFSGGGIWTSPSASGTFTQRQSGSIYDSTLWYDTGTGKYIMFGTGGSAANRVIYDTTTPISTWTRAGQWDNWSSTGSWVCYYGGRAFGGGSGDDPPFGAAPVLPTPITTWSGNSSLPGTTYAPHSVAAGLGWVVALQRKDGGGETYGLYTAPGPEGPWTENTGMGLTQGSTTNYLDEVVFCGGYWILILRGASPAYYNYAYTTDPTGTWTHVTTTDVWTSAGGVTKPIWNYRLNRWWVFGNDASAWYLDGGLGGTWTKSSFTIGGTVTDALYFEQYVVLSTSNTTYSIQYWIDITTPTSFGTVSTHGFGANVVRSICYGQLENATPDLAYFIAAGDNGVIQTAASLTGTYTTRTSGFGTTAIRRVRTVGGIIVAVGDTGKLSTATSVTGSFTLQTAGGWGTTNLNGLVVSRSQGWIVFNAGASKIYYPSALQRAATFKKLWTDSPSASATITTDTVAAPSTAQV